MHSASATLVYLGDSTLRQQVNILPCVCDTCTHGLCRHFDVGSVPALRTPVRALPLQRGATGWVYIPADTGFMQACADSTCHLFFGVCLPCQSLPLLSRPGRCQRHTPCVLALHASGVWLLLPRTSICLHADVACSVQAVGVQGLQGTCWHFSMQGSIALFHAACGQPVHMAVAVHLPQQCREPRGCLCCSVLSILCFF